VVPSKGDKFIGEINNFMEALDATIPIEDELEKWIFSGN